MKSMTPVEKRAVGNEVKGRFKQLVAALNAKDKDAWSEFYSRGGFLSAIVGTEFLVKRNEWVSLISGFFSQREYQHVEPVKVRVSALAPDLALMTSEEMTKMQLKGGKTIKSQHVFTMIWKKEQGGWKILHSHESWVDNQSQ